MSESSYWQDYYLKSNLSYIPSQFAVFVANELANYSSLPFIVEIGCGNGKDTIFFNKLGFNAIGFDQSDQAISSGIKYCSDNGIDLQTTDQILFARDLNNISLLDVKDKVNQLNSKALVIYTRFFLHAIDDDEEIIFWELLDKIGDIYSIDVYLEFRNINDKDRCKETSDHYRRYLDNNIFYKTATLHGFDVEYFVEGMGLAKFKTDDAYVSRFKLSKQCC